MSVLPTAKTAAKRAYRASRSFAGNVLRESMTHYDRLRQDKRLPRAVFFSSQDDSGGSGFLRARGVGLALRQFGWRTAMPSASLTLAQRRRIVALEKPDVIVFQQARHPLNRPSLFAPTPSVFDLDDADILDPRCAASVIECIRESSAAVGGSRFVADLMRPYNDDVSVIWTSIDSSVRRKAHSTSPRGRVIAWASLRPEFFRPEADLVQQAMIQLARQTSFTFRLYGASDRWNARDPAWAESFVAPIRAAGADVELMPLLSYEDFLRSLESVAIGLSPVCLENEHSRGRSFGKILAYLNSGSVVLASNNVDHPLFFRTGENGYLLENSPEAWASTCADLIADPDLMARVALAGFNGLESRFTADVAAKLLDRVLRRVIS